MSGKQYKIIISQEEQSQKKSADLQEVQRVHGLPWHQCFQQDPERTHHYVSELGRTTGNVAIETSDVHYKLKDFHILMGYNGV